MAIAASDLRGSHARRVEYSPGSGKAMMLEIIQADHAVVKRERGFSVTIQQQPASGPIEMFD